MVEDYTFECTCGACPEQYDVIRKRDGKCLGYIRCRWGLITAHPVIDNKIDWENYIYVEDIDPSGWRGVIDDTDKVFEAVAEKLDEMFPE